MCEKEEGWYVTFNSLVTFSVVLSWVGHVIGAGRPSRGLARGRRAGVRNASDGRRVCAERRGEGGCSCGAVSPRSGEGVAMDGCCCGAVYTNNVFFCREVLFCRGERRLSVASLGVWRLGFVPRSRGVFSCIPCVTTRTITHPVGRFSKLSFFDDGESANTQSPVSIERSDLSKLTRRRSPPAHLLPGTILNRTYMYTKT